MALLTDSASPDSYPRRRTASTGIPVPEPAPMPVPTQQPTPAPAPQQPGPNYQTLGSFSNRLQGVDMNKFTEPYDKWSEKYKVAAVNSWFDPSKGITPEYLAALNGLNIADFSGSADGLRVANSRNGARYGAGGGDDVIANYAKGQNPGGAMWSNWSSQETQAKQRAFNASRRGEGPAQGADDLSAIFAQMFPPQQQMQQGPDMGALLAEILSMFAQPQQQQAPAAPQQAQAPGYQPSAPQTQAAQMPSVRGANYGGNAVTTQGPMPAPAPPVDPFTEWLQQSVFGGPNASV